MVHNDQFLIEMYVMALRRAVLSLDGDLHPFSGADGGKGSLHQVLELDVPEQIRSDFLIVQAGHLVGLSIATASAAKRGFLLFTVFAQVCRFQTIFRS